jgi:hypothetical protein
MKARQFIVAVIFSASASIASAGTISVTGAQLLSYPGVVFPATVPRIEGTSLLFDGGTNGFEKLLSFQAYTGPAPDATGIEVSVALNLTMRPCEGPACLGLGDWDPIFLLGDGTTLFGVQLSNDGDLIVRVMDDLGSSAADRSGFYFYDRSAPVLGDALDIGLVFNLGTANTSLTIYYDGSPQTYTGGPALDTASGIDFVFMRDNDVGEQHQINTLTATSPSIEPLRQVPEPPSLAIMGLGLILAGVMSRGRRPAVS